MGLCGFSPKISAIIAGIVTLLQGLIWSIIGILSLLVYSCSIYAPEGSNAFYRIYLVYLYKEKKNDSNFCINSINLIINQFSAGGKCGTVEIETESENGTVFLTWPENGTKLASRTFAWIIVYLVFSLFWVIGSLLLVIATVSDVRGVKGVVLRSPWLVLTSLFVILDIITSVFYSIDISYTSNLEELLEFVGLIVEPDIINSSSTSPIFGYLTMSASIIAVVIFSRLIIGWALNLVMLIHIAQDAKNSEKPEPSVLPEPRQPFQEYLKKLSTIGPVPDVRWDPYQRKRSDLPVMKPLEVPSPPNERKRKQSDYQQYLFYAKKSSQLNYLDDIKSEPPTPAVGSEPTTTGVWRVTTPQADTRDDFNLSEDKNLPVPLPAPDY